MRFWDKIAWLTEIKPVLDRDRGGAILPDHHVGRNDTEIRSGISSP